MIPLNEKEHTEPFCIIGSKGKFHPSYRFYLPALERALDIPKEEVIKFYKNIDDKAELFLREKLYDIQKQVQEHRSNREVHYSDKKTNKKEYKYK